MNRMNRTDEKSIVFYYCNEPNTIFLFIYRSTVIRERNVIRCAAHLQKLHVENQIKNTIRKEKKKVFFIAFNNINL